MAIEPYTAGIVDSSVLLAALKNEPCSLPLEDLLDGAVMSAVNLSEVFAKASEFGLAKGPRLNTLLGLLDRIEPFTAHQARIAADLRETTRGVGLSLGDRACLALAIDLGLGVYTADRRWSDATLACSVMLIR